MHKSIVGYNSFTAIEEDFPETIFCLPGAGYQLYLWS